MENVAFFDCKVAFFYCWERTHPQRTPLCCVFKPIRNEVANSNRNGNMTKFYLERPVPEGHFMVYCYMGKDGTL